MHAFLRVFILHGCACVQVCVYVPECVSQCVRFILYDVYLLVIDLDVETELMCLLTIYTCCTEIVRRKKKRWAYTCVCS